MENIVLKDNDDWYERYIDAQNLIVRRNPRINAPDDKKNNNLKTSPDAILQQVLRGSGHS